MCKKRDKRWLRWNNLILEGKSIVVVKEFDKMISNKEFLTVGDLIVRDQALEKMGIISLSPNAIYNRKIKNAKCRKRKSKA
jgi:hypothetical protein